ncbi:hypothetical protein [Mycobacterium sp.]|nr:hypothetical protein [Mycobacterium sp.]
MTSPEPPDGLDKSEDVLAPATPGAEALGDAGTEDEDSEDAAQ